MQDRKHLAAMIERHRKALEPLHFDIIEPDGSRNIWIGTPSVKVPGGWLVTMNRTSTCYVTAAILQAVTPADPQKTSGFAAQESSHAGRPTPERKEPQELRTKN